MICLIKIAIKENSIPLLFDVFFSVLREGDSGKFSDILEF